MTPRQSPSIELDLFDCPYCLAFSHHLRGNLEIKAKFRSGSNSFWSHSTFTDSSEVFTAIGTDVVRYSDPSDVDDAAEWTYSLCVACGRASVWRGDSLLYPSGSTVDVPHPDMPAQASELYLEARAVLPVSRRAAAALARASLEALLRELDSQSAGKRLDDLVAELRTRVGETLWQLLTALRVVGNDALHSESGDLVVLFLNGDRDVAVEPLFGAINEIVEQVITQPKTARELYKMIPEGKRATAEKKASNLSA